MNISLCYRAFIDVILCVCVFIFSHRFMRPIVCTRQNNEVYDWSQEQQGIILSSFFWGYLATQILGGIISQCYGGKYVFVLGILFSAFCSLLTPIVVRQCKLFRFVFLIIFIFCSLFLFSGMPHICFGIRFVGLFTFICIVINGSTL